MAPPAPPSKNVRKLHRLLLTGAAGGVGRVLRERLAPFAEVLRLSDRPRWARRRAPMRKSCPATWPTRRRCAGCWPAAMPSCTWRRLGRAAVRGDPRGQPARPSSISTRRRACGRCAASSWPAPTTRSASTGRASASTPPPGSAPTATTASPSASARTWRRCTSSATASRTVSIRIGSALPEPTNRRQLSTWISYRDLTSLIEAALFTPDVGHTIVFGASASRDPWWDNSAAAHLGWTPQDDSETYRARIEAQPPLAADDPNGIYQGGFFVDEGPFD